MNPLKFYITCFLVLAFIVPAAYATVSTVTVTTATFTNSATPSLTIILTPDANLDLHPKMSFSCDGTNFSAAPLDFASSTNLFNITIEPGCNANDEPKTIFVKVADDETAGGAIGSASVTLDTAAPTTTYAISPATPNGLSNYYIHTAPTITLGCTDTTSQTGCIVKYKWNSDAEQTYSAPFAVIQGANQLTYYSIDGAGNAQTGQNVSINVDTQADFSGFTASDTNNATTLHLTLQGTAADFSGTPCAVLVDSVQADSNKAFQTTTDTNVAWNQTDGNKSVTVQCTDIHGNTQDRNKSVLLDRSAPSVPDISFLTILSNQINLHWSAVTDPGTGVQNIFVYRDGSLVATLGAAIQDFNVTGLSAGTNYTFAVVARDKAGNETRDQDSTITLGTSVTPPSNGNPSGFTGGSSGDSIAPTGIWQNPTDAKVVAGKIVFKFKATDSGGVKETEFFLDVPTNSLKKVTTKKDDVFEFEWDSATVADGSHKLIAVPRDFSGNAQSISITVTVSNAGTSQDSSGDDGSAEPDSNASADESTFEARFLKIQSDLFWLFVISGASTNDNSFNSDFKNQLQDAKNLFSDARTASFSQEMDLANEKMGQAEEIIGQLQETAGLASFSAFDSRSIDSTFPLSSLELQSAGLNGELASFSLQASNLVSGSRELFVFEQDDGAGGKKYFVKIIVKIKNTSNAPQDLIFIENIPKLLAQNAGQLVSDADFVVLQDDPLVQWSFNQVPPGEEVQVSFAPQRFFSESEVQDMLEGKTLLELQNKPLIVTKQSMENTKALFSPTPLLAGFASLGTNVFVGYGALAAVLLFALFSFAFWNAKREEPVFSWNEPRFSGKPVIEPKKEAGGVPLLWNPNAVTQKNALANLINADKKPHLQPKTIHGEPVNWWKEKRPPAN